MYFFIRQSNETPFKVKTQASLGYREAKNDTYGRCKYSFQIKEKQKLVAHKDTVTDIVQVAA